MPHLGGTKVPFATGGAGTDDRNHPNVNAAVPQEHKGLGRIEPMPLIGGQVEFHGGQTLLDLRHRGRSDQR